MTLSQKTKRILLIFIPAALVAAVIVLGVLLWQPWAPSRDRQKIDQLSTYEGCWILPLRKSPCTARPAIPITGSPFQTKTSFKPGRPI